MDTWKNAYSYKVEPIKGRIMWPKSLCPTTLVPPIHHTQPGRPTKKRKKSEDEKLSQSQRGSQSQTGTHGVSQEEGCKVGPDGVQKLTRKYVSVTCANAKTKVTTQGHAKVKEVEVRWKLKIKVVFVLADVICYF